MHLLKVGAASLNQTPLDWSGNKARVIEAIVAAEADNVELLCLPELCVTGYGCEDHFQSYDVQRKAIDSLADICEYMCERELKIKVCVGLPMLHGNALYNVVAMIDSGRILGFVAKQHLAGDGLHYEPRWFKPWPAGVCHEAHGAPFGDLMFEFEFQDESTVRVGFEICEDAWVADRPGNSLSRHGVDVILNPSASHFAFGKYEVRQGFIREGSRAFGATYVYANLQGNESGRAIYDGGNLIATRGGLVGFGKRFSFKAVEITTAVVDIDATRTQQSSSASFLPNTNNFPIVAGVEPMLESEESVSRSYAIYENEALDEFEQAISLALFDYLRKARSKGFALSLSGGADSAACAVLVKKMWETGLDTFGESKFLFELGLPEGVAFTDILTCMYQGTRNSSDVTLNAAKDVAEGLGAKFLNVSVDVLVEGYTKMMEVALGRALNWEDDDLALQNIQARVRSPSIWMIANIEGKLLITTSNRSEAAVGYCTMDGDTSGSIAPIGGIGKAFLLRWLRSKVDEFPFLKTVTDQRPTAELRPGESTQTDETDLMPYEILEKIEDLAILDKKSPLEIYKSFSRTTGPLGTTVAGQIEKFFRLWCRNQWKRERYALSFHVDKKNLDPRSWCRFPVLSGGFEAELAEMWAYVNKGYETP